jgi:hypothetical protein
MIEDGIKAVNLQEEIMLIHTENPEGFMELDIGDE